MQIQPTTNKIQPTANKIQPTTNKIQPTTNKIQPTANKIQPTTNKSRRKGMRWSAFGKQPLPRRLQYPHLYPDGEP